MKKELAKMPTWKLLLRYFLRLLPCLLFVCMFSMSNSTTLELSVVIIRFFFVWTTSTTMMMYLLLNVWLNNALSSLHTTHMSL